MGERMTKSDLDKWRFRVPFIIVSSTIIPFFICVIIKDADLEVKIIQYVITPASFIFAFFYSAMKLRKYCWYRELNKYVGAQIKDELIKLVPADLKCSDEEKLKLKEKEIWQKLYGVFWEAIDSEPNLVKNKEHFYANGALYTTSIDVYIILLFFGLIYILLYFIIANALLLLFGVLCLIVALLSKCLALPSCRRHHLELSSEQLNYLRRNKKDFIANKFRQIIQEWRAK
jgi:hypothetical protein